MLSITKISDKMYTKKGYGRFALICSGLSGDGKRG